MSMDDEVRVLAQLEGPLYRALRDSLLQRAAGLAEVIARYRSDADWRLAMTAAILQGWSERRALYTQVLAELDQVNPGARSAMVTGVVGIWEEFELRAFREFGPPVLPLAWEHIVKLAGGVPTWRTGTWLAMIAGVPMEASVEPVVHLVETSNDKVLRDRAAMTLSRLPAAAVDKRLERLSAHAAGLADTVRSARALRR